MKTDSITIPRWFDAHLHLRDGGMMENVLPCTLAQRPTGAIIMPNLMKPGGIADPVDTVEKAVAYHSRILGACTRYLRTAEIPQESFTPCMTCYLTDHTDPEEVVRGYQEGIWKAVKLYMADQQGRGGTTGSGHGVRNLLGRYKVFEAMEKYGIPLLGHFEAVEDDVDEFDREIISAERDYVPILDTFSGLLVVFEHLTDGRVADMIAQTPRENTFASVSAHHPMVNRNAMFNGGMNPLYFCKPVPKREEHRLRVRRHITSGNRRFRAGTDSAPHDEANKARCCGCAAGMFTAPVAVELYATIFDEDDALEHLGPFLSENFLHIYDMEVSKEMMTIVREETHVPEKVGSVLVFKGGETLPWKLVR